MQPLKYYGKFVSEAERILLKCERRSVSLISYSIKRESGEMEFNSKATSVIRQEDTLVLMGETRQLKALEDLVGV